MLVLTMVFWAAAMAVLAYFLVQEFSGLKKAVKAKVGAPSDWTTHTAPSQGASSRLCRTSGRSGASAWALEGSARAAARGRGLAPRRGGSSSSSRGINIREHRWWTHPLARPHTASCLSARSVPVYPYASLPQHRNTCGGPMHWHDFADGVPLTARLPAATSVRLRFCP